MATTERDYYELLAVSRTASADEIKRAFRRLAREVHPDVSNEPDADHRFREIVEAYEVLSNSERRELYDRFGHAGLRSGGFQPTAFDLGNLSDLFSAFFGDDIFGGGGGVADAGAAPTSPPRSRSTSPRWRRGPIVRCRSASPFHARVAEGTARSPIPRFAPARLAEAAVACARFRAACSASSCARGRARHAPGRGSSSRAVRAVPRRRPRDRGAHPGGRDTARHPRRAAHQVDRRRSFGNAGRSSRRRVRGGARPPRRPLRARRQRLYTTVDLTFTQAALGATVSVPTLEGEAS